ncbi:MAG: UDP-N-acetylmuramoyl-tripeptide--D-alanyl-D-alanine ligase [Patescibacteria group bacterium]
MILRNLLYILQSENYSFPRFLSFCYSHPLWWRLERRQKIVWTPKARALWMMSIIFFWGAVYAAVLFFGWMMGALFFLFFLVMVPFFVGAALLALLPCDTFLKRRKVSRASTILQASGVRVIGITGSYGKTSTKEILAAILERGFPVIKTPENINTDIGIADFVIRHATEFAEDKIFIVEMGAHKKGEIRSICKMVHPEYSILIGINEAHLERFGSLENIISGKFELPLSTRKLAILNCDDENVRQHYQEFVKVKTICVTEADAQDVSAKDDFQGFQFDWQGMRFETALLARHNITLILLAATLAQELGLPLPKIRDAVKEIKPIPHRLEPICNPATDIMVIDDSYNGNINGVISGIGLLGRAKGRKVVLTPGLVELGTESKRAHRRIGELYAQKADLVLLIKSQATPYIIEGLKQYAFTDYTVYNTTEEAHQDLSRVLRSGDTIIFQNDLTDNYF